MPKSMSPGLEKPSSSKVWTFLDDRLGLSQWLEFASHKTVPLHTHTFWYYWGGLSLFFFLIQALTGVLLMVYYRPGVEAYDSVRRITYDIDFGWLIRSAHSWSANLMIVAIFVHMFSVFFMRAYRDPREFGWWSGLILLGVTMTFGFSGYLLPWDQLSLWAVTIGASMIEAAPPEVVGTNLNLLLRGGPEIGANGLLRFYLLHVLAVPALLFVFLGVHYYKVVVHAHSLPPREENIGEDTAKRVPLDKRVYFIPDILTSEIMWIGVTTLVLVVLVTWFFHAPLENHADPQVTPLGTKLASTGGPDSGTREM